MVLSQETNSSTSLAFVVFDQTEITLVSVDVEVEYKQENLKFGVLPK